MAPNQIAILTAIVVGLAATVATIAIHGVVLHTIVMSLRRDLKRGLLGARIWVNMTFVMVTVLDLSGAVPDVSAAIYSSAGSYTTSGSDIMLPPQWKLPGPFEAVDGMLMFGVSTAFIFALVNRLISARFNDEDQFRL
jgi:hypothetical protein